MPIIQATPFVDQGYVLVDVNWADVPAATCIRVVRVHVNSGEEFPLRPYIAPCGENGEYIQTSGGRAIFWDTEAPLDTAFFYRTDAAGVTFADQTIHDTWSRTLTDSWGTSSSGHPWTIDGTASEFDVNGSVGLHSNGTLNDDRLTYIGGTDITDVIVNLQTATPVTATGASITSGSLIRVLNENNFYRLTAIFNTTGQVSATINKRVAAVNTTLASTGNLFAYSPNVMINTKFEGLGSTLRAKLWALGSPEPTTWTMTTTDTDLLMGRIGCRSLVNAGNTNALPVALQFDNLTAVLAGTQLETEILTLPSNGYFWLRDPVRPCRDQRLTTSKMLPENCPPGSGVFFVQIDTERYPGNSITMLPTNARRLISVSRERRDAETSLTVATRTFADRDNVLLLNQPGSPLLFQAAPNYGIPDRYMAIAEVNVVRGLADHRRQPRVINMPYSTVDRPVGTTTGICGSRFMDLCDIYDTWDEMTAAGLLYSQLVSGGASDPDEGFNTWADVDAAYADWAAVDAGNADWDAVEGGP